MKQGLPDNQLVHQVLKGNHEAFVSPPMFIRVFCNYLAV
mgnify:CR=1 FL=1